MKQIINTPLAPAPIGPYSQAVKVGHTVFCSGQIAINPATGELITDTIESETHQVMKNISEVLKAAGGDLSHVVKTSIFLSDMGLFAHVNGIYSTYFTSDFPARETVEVS